MRPSDKYLCQCVSSNNTKNTTVFPVSDLTFFPTTNVSIRKEKSPASYLAGDFSDPKKSVLKSEFLIVLYGQFCRTRRCIRFNHTVAIRWQCTFTDLFGRLIIEDVNPVHPVRTFRLVLIHQINFTGYIGKQKQHTGKFLHYSLRQKPLHLQLV